MPADAETLIGVNKVGEHDQASTPVDTEWGRTTEDGAVVQLSTTKQELFSAQAKMAEDTHINRVAMAIQATVIFAELTTFQEMLAIDAAQLAGDLDGATPEDEVLTIDQDSIGAVEKGLFVETPGPVSTRRYEAARALLGDVGDIQLSDTQWQQVQVTMDLINTADGTGVLVITDAA